MEEIKENLNQTIENSENNTKNIFEKLFGDLAEQDKDAEITRTHMLLIKKYIDEIKKHEKELTVEEIKSIFEAEFAKDITYNLEFEKANIIRLRKLMEKNKIYDELLNLYKNNKSEFNRRLNTAKEREIQKVQIITQKDGARFKTSQEKNKEIDESGEEICFDRKEDSITALRMVLRTKQGVPRASEIDILKYQKTKTEELVELYKTYFTECIKKDVEFLEKYGIIDNFIESANKHLNSINLQSLNYVKRNPITSDKVVPVPDGRILKENDENGKKVKYSEEDSIVREEHEDIGVLDTFEDEVLNELTAEDLLLLHIFWRSKAVNASYEISKAKVTMDHLGLWEEFVEKDEEIVDEIKKEDIITGIKIDMGLTYINVKKEGKIEDEVNELYEDFLEFISGEKIELDENVKEKIKQEVEKMSKEVSDFSMKDTILASLLAYTVTKLQKDDLGIKNWGVIDEEDKDLVFVVENPKMRGPLIFSLQKAYLEAFFETKDLKLPKYKNEKSLDNAYTDAMSKLYLPRSRYFDEAVNEEYKKDKTSNLIANLAGKKAKKAKKDQEVR